MKLQPWMPYAALVVLAFAAHARTFLRAYPFGADPYYFMAGNFTGYSGLWAKAAPYLYMNSALSAALLTALTAIVAFELAKAFGAKRPLLSAALMFAAPQFIIRMAEVEDDLLATPICFLLLLLYIRFDNEKALPSKVIYALLGASVFIFSAMIWKGAYLFAFVIGLNELLKISKWFAAILLPVYYYLTRPVTMVAEQIPGILICFLGLGICNGFLRAIYTPHKNRTLMTMALFFGGLTMLQAKWIWIFAFFAALLTAEFFGDWLLENRTGNMVLVGGMLFGLLYASMAIVAAPPSVQLMSDMKDVHAITGDAPIANSWWYGHWLVWLGANPIYTNLHPQPNLTVTPDAEYVLAAHGEPFTSPCLVRNYSEFALFEAPRRCLP